MKKYLPYFYLFCLIVALYASTSLTKISKDVLATFSFTFLPSLAPAMLFDYLFLHADGLYTLYSFLEKRSKHPQVIYRNLILILGLLSGTPSLASYVEDSLKKGLLSKKEGELLLGCYLLPSFPFIFGVLFPLLSSLKKSILFLALYLPSTIYYLLYSRKCPERKIKIQPSANSNYIQAAILSTFQTLILLLGTMLLFSFPLLFLKQIPNLSLSYFLYGLFEFANPALFFAKGTTPFSFSILICLLTFSSFSVYVQVRLLAPSISLLSLIKKRLLFVGVNLFFCFLYFLLF